MQRENEKLLENQSNGFRWPISEMLCSLELSETLSSDDKFIPSAKRY